MSHELRTPLNASRYTELIFDKVYGDTGQERGVLDSIETQRRHLLA